MNGLQGMRAHITRRLEDNSQKLVFAFHLVRAGSVVFLPLAVHTRLAGQFSSSVSYLTVGAGFIDAGVPSWLFMWVLRPARQELLPADHLESLTSDRDSAVDITREGAQMGYRKALSAKLGVRAWAIDMVETAQRRNGS